MVFDDYQDLHNNTIVFNNHQKSYYNTIVRYTKSGH